MPTGNGENCLPSVVPVSLQTARLLLRTPVESDRGAYLAARAANQAFLQPWEPLRPAESPDESFTRLLANVDSDTTQRTFVFTADGTLIGGVSISNISRGPFQSASVGYWLIESAQRQGYMREAVLAMLAHAFGAASTGGLGLHRVECNVMPRNAPSIALARRLGFREEGFSPRYLQINGVWEGHLRFAMTAEEFSITA
jgi:ribosomal-protein-alanine N-acetyltransferase